MKISFNFEFDCNEAEIKETGKVLLEVLDKMEQSKKQIRRKIIETVPAEEQPAPAKK